MANGRVAELADALDLGSSPERGAGSSPVSPTGIKLSDFCPTDSAARSAERYGFTGSPRTARLAKRRFEPKISLAAPSFEEGCFPCDFGEGCSDFYPVLEGFEPIILLLFNPCHFLVQRLLFQKEFCFLFAVNFSFNILL